MKIPVKTCHSPHKVERNWLVLQTRLALGQKDPTEVCQHTKVNTSRLRYLFTLLQHPSTKNICLGAKEEPEKHLLNESWEATPRGAFPF